MLKIGTKVKNIRLVEGDHNIDCKIDGFGPMKLKSEFVKRTDLPARWRFAYRAHTTNGLFLREVKIMPLSPYISFAGNCAEATAFISRPSAQNSSIKSPSAKCQKRAKKAARLACSSRTPL